MSDKVQDVAEAVGADVEELFEALSAGRRRQRQDASHQLAIIAHQDPTKLHDHTDELVDALYRPEAQTRWEVLDALSEVVSEKADVLDGAYDGAETSLFDESSSTVRLAAFRFLTRYGATSLERSDRVWGIVDEAIQCYHGDPDYRDMLGCLRDFARGDVSADTRKALVTRVKFDADSGRGFVKLLSEEIIDISKAVEKEAKRAAREKAVPGDGETRPAKKATRKKATKAADEEEASSSAE
ncbi:MAG: hypothetical protein IJI16_07200 [Atopobiaceae bacterium]|nr:hypothetical protein [Atopobiaceae bacterium]MBQ3282338.1 hypothetical protein [Atopobiaceae bacterium]MBQ6411718.1 hypothetical protein [Atopobiaceae bacterium]MBQ6651128.1 hypothetical protein [Atopobiaceae bacterium]MBR3384116.1 hypothetical protein [Atopobiaceae bacterium]